MTSNYLLSLPFDLHVVIARNLTLQECLTYSSLSLVCHDAVYYIFAHRIELDFGSLIIANGRLTVSSEDFLKILHAHSRAETIRNFCIPDNFSAYTKLSLFFQLYWEHVYIPSYDPSDLEPSMICGTHVGHIRGHLSRIRYLGFYGAFHKHQSEHMHDILRIYDDDMYGLNIAEENNPNHVLTDETNWSTTNLDAPYTACSQCHLHIEYPESQTNHASQTNLCWQCTRITNILHIESDTNNS